MSQIFFTNIFSAGSLGAHDDGEDALYAGLARLGPGGQGALDQRGQLVPGPALREAVKKTLFIDLNLEPSY